MIKHGRIITSESYFDGKAVRQDIYYSLPVRVKDKSEVLNEIIKAIDLITSKRTHEITIKIKADSNYIPQKITKEYVVEHKIV